MSKRAIISIFVFMLVAPVLFGVGLVTVLMIPALQSHQPVLLAGVIILSGILGAPLSWLLAPRLQSRYLRTHPQP